MNAALPTLDLDALDFVKGNGLVTVVAQDALSGAVLMVAHADREALDCTLRTGEMHYRSAAAVSGTKGPRAATCSGLCRSHRTAMATPCSPA